jgi:hypothetical protein
MIRRTPTEIRQLVCAGKWQRKHLLAVQQQFGDDLLFDALFGVFAGGSHSLQDQQLAGRYLIQLHPNCHLPLALAVRRSLAHWNLSVEELPVYFWRVFGRDAVSEALLALEIEGVLADSELRAIQTYRFWLRAGEQKMFSYETPGN